MLLDSVWIIRERNETGMKSRMWMEEERLLQGDKRIWALILGPASNLPYMTPQPLCVLDDKSSQWD